MHRRTLLRRATIVLAVLAIGGGAGLAIDIARVGGLDAWLRARMPTVFPTFDVPPYDARGRLVDVAGRSVYLDCRGAGSPTVILETGFGGGADGWGYVLDRVAGVTRVCAWDRPGIGRSTSRGLHTGGEAEADLRAALETAGEQGPYIVVAHSLGGIYARLFAAAGPPNGRAATEHDAVLGFVMLDIYEPDLGMDRDPALPPDVRAFIRQNLDAAGPVFQQGEGLDWTATLAELERLGPTTLPAVLLMADPHQHLTNPDPAVVSAMVDAWYRAIAARYPNGRLQIVNTSHFVQFDRPDLVLDEVRRLVSEARAGQSGGPGATSGPSG